MRVSAAFIAPLLVLSLGAPLFATDFVVPKQAVVGAEKPIPLGELVDLSLSPLEEKPPHLVGVTSTWKVFDAAGQEKRVREYSGGIFFGAGIRKTKLKAVVAITYLYAVKKEDGTVQEVATRTVLSTQDVVIGDDGIPDPKPGPDPNPNPGPVAKAWIVVIEETQEASAQRGKFLEDRALVDYVAGKKWAVRVADKDAKGPDGKPPADLAPYLTRASGKQLPQMYIVSDARDVLYEGAVPATPADLLALLRKLGG
jgi:hypothetical protein